MTVEEELAKPLSADHIAKRQQGGQNLSYIESHHAIREANRIFGFGGWQRVTSDLNIVQQEEKAKSGGNGTNWYVGYTARCEVHASIDGDDVIRVGTGFGQGIDADLGRAHESAIKEAESDAMKRALMTFGDPFGLALYDKKQEHVEKPAGSAQNRQQPEPARKPQQWDGAALKRILADNDLKMGDLAPILGSAVTTQNYATLINAWLAGKPDRDLNKLAERAKAMKAPLPEVTPEDLSPYSDVRPMAGVN